MDLAFKNFRRASKNDQQWQKCQKQGTDDAFRGQNGTRQAELMKLQVKLERNSHKAKEKKKKETNTNDAFGREYRTT